MSERDEIGETLLKLAGNGASPKDIIKEIKSRFPHAKRKDVTEAAFWMVVGISASDPGNALKLQALALDERAGPDEDLEPKGSRKKRKWGKRRSDDAEPSRTR